MSCGMNRPVRIGTTTGGWPRSVLTRRIWPPVEFHTRQLQAIEEVRANGRCTPFEVDLIRRDGRRIPVLVGGARLSARRREGVAFVLDISDRRELGRRMAAELACADALLDAPTRDQAIVDALAAVCATLEWNLAQIWRRSAAGELALVASQGKASADSTVLQRAASLALDAGKAQWSNHEAILAVPMSSDTSLVVAHSGPSALCPWVVETTHAIAARVQTFLKKNLG